VTEQLAALLRTLWGIDPATVTADTTLSGLDLDSLSLVELAERVRQDLGVEVDDDELRELDRIGDVAALLADRHAAADA
jgi:acyl carrier protein